MIQLTSSASQTVLPGESVVFDTVPMHTGNGEHHRNGTASVKLRALNGIYQIHFNADVSGLVPNEQIRIDIIAGGCKIPGSSITRTISDILSTENVSVSVPFCNSRSGCGCVSVVNAGQVPFVICPDANLFIRRLS